MACMQVFCLAVLGYMWLLVYVTGSVRLRPGPSHSVMSASAITVHRC